MEDPSGVPPENSTEPDARSGLAIFGFGCIGVALLVFIAVGAVGYKGFQKLRKAYEHSESSSRADDALVMAASLRVNTTPGFEIVGVDKTRRVMTIRHTASGKLVTMPLLDVAEGKFIPAKD